MIKYITLKDCEIVEHNTLLDLAAHFEIEVSDNGVVTIDGRIDTISYKMSEFTKQEAYEDFVKTRLSHFKTIYKAERL